MITMTAEHQTAKKHCDCGCGSQPDCCELECLVQPRFFCGQLLADQDLTAMVDWVKAKAALARYRHGWGIVCGLDVHCGPRGSVRVSTGYALDCCGRDIVVCKETIFDVSKCWQRPEDPCGNGALPRRRQLPRDEAVFSSGTTASSFDDFEVPSGEVQAVDLFIRYSESESDARTALARGGCGGAAGCEYTRVHEGYELYCKPAPDCQDPNAAIVDAWDEAYFNGLTEMFDAFNAMSGLQDPRRRLGRLLAFLKEYPLHTFCYVREWLCDLEDGEEDLPERWFENALFLIVQDWRNQYFRARCQGCGPDTGVLLARVWLWMRRVENRERFSTLYVDAYQPFRRYLEKDDYPAPPGYVNMAPFIWQPVDVASLKLRDLGFTSIVLQQFAAPADLIALRSTFVRRNAMFIQHNSDSLGRLFVYYWVDHCGIRRVVGITTPLLLRGDPVTDTNPTPAAGATNGTAGPEATNGGTGRRSRSKP